jgi:FlaG/FlaF family flagellin (archaellin)
VKVTVGLQAFVITIVTGGKPFEQEATEGTKVRVRTGTFPYLILSAISFGKWEF